MSPSTIASSNTFAGAVGRGQADEIRGTAEIEAHMAEFAELAAQGASVAAGAGSLDHLLDVSCSVTAELGRLNMSLGDITKLNIGSVVELDRMISEPVDVFVQGVLLARGEVVVVNDHFAVRIKEIVDPRKRS